MHRLGLLVSASPSVNSPLAEHEWWLADLSHTLEMPSVTLYNWIKRGWVQGRQLPEKPYHWVVWADDVELERLRNHRHLPVGEVLRQRWNGEVPLIAQKPKPPIDFH